MRSIGLLIAAVTVGLTVAFPYPTVEEAKNLPTDGVNEKAEVVGETAPVVPTTAPAIGQKADDSYAVNLKKYHAHHHALAHHKHLFKDGSSDSDDGSTNDDDSDSDSDDDSDSDSTGESDSSGDDSGSDSSDSDSGSEDSSSDSTESDSSEFDSDSESSSSSGDDSGSDSSESDSGSRDSSSDSSSSTHDMSTRSKSKSKSKSHHYGHHYGYHHSSKSHDSSDFDDGFGTFPQVYPDYGDYDFISGTKGKFPASADTANHFNIAPAPNYALHSPPIASPLENLGHNYPIQTQSAPAVSFERSSQHIAAAPAYPQAAPSYGQAQAVPIFQAPAAPAY